MQYYHLGIMDKYGNIMDVKLNDKDTYVIDFSRNSQQTPCVFNSLAVSKVLDWIDRFCSNYYLVIELESERKDDSPRRIEG